MQTTIIILIGTAMVITSIVNFAKPAYEQFAGKWDATVNIALSFILGVCSAFAVAPYLEFQLSAGALVSARNRSESLLWLMGISTEFGDE